VSALADVERAHGIAGAPSTPGTFVKWSNLITPMLHGEINRSGVNH
jgi:hypothetical protein